MKYLISFFLLCFFTLQTADWHPSYPLKVLHLTFHKGCQKEVEALAKEFDMDLTTWFIPDLPPEWFDGKTSGSVLYNIGRERAERIWNKHRNFFEAFDLVITTDTAPLSRIFLQNEWKKPLIIWICNRFDYFDNATLDCSFPDQEYYDLFDSAHLQENVRVVAYTLFEHFYALNKGVDTGTLTITPGLTIHPEPKESGIPAHIHKPDTFFLPPYLNETSYMNLSQHCTSLGIPNYCGRYCGPHDLKDFKGIIHLPYAWSNLALFENLQNGMVYFIPSPDFFLTMLSDSSYFHTDMAFIKDKKYLHLSEWYSPKLQPYLIYFDSWKDLQDKISKTNYADYRGRIKIYAQKYRAELIKKWGRLLKEISTPY